MSLWEYASFVFDVLFAIHPFPPVSFMFLSSLVFDGLVMICVGTGFLYQVPGYVAPYTCGCLFYLTWKLFEYYYCLSTCSALCLRLQLLYGLLGPKFSMGDFSPYFNRETAPRSKLRQLQGYLCLIRHLMSDKSCPCVFLGLVAHRTEILVAVKPHEKKERTFPSHL